MAREAGRTSQRMGHTPVLEETDEYLEAISEFMREAEPHLTVKRRASPDA